MLQATVIARMELTPPIYLRRKYDIPLSTFFSGKSHAKFTMEKRAEIIYEATQMFPMLFFRVVESTRTTHAK